MELLFISYNEILHDDGIQQMLKFHPMIEVWHVIVAVKLGSLKNPLRNNMGFSHLDLKKDFKGFLKHALEIAEGFCNIDVEPIKTDESNNKIPSSNRKGLASVGRKSDSKPNIETKNRDHKLPHQPEEGQRKLPLCLTDRFEKAGRRHHMDKGDFSTKEEHKVALDAHRSDRKQIGPESSTRSKQISGNGKSVMNGM